MDCNFFSLSTKRFPKEIDVQFHLVFKGRMFHRIIIVTSQKTHLNLVQHRLYIAERPDLFLLQPLQEFFVRPYSFSRLFFARQFDCRFLKLFQMQFVPGHTIDRLHPIPQEL